MIFVSISHRLPLQQWSLAASVTLVRSRIGTKRRTCCQVGSYIVLAVLGEAALLTGLMIGADASEDFCRSPRSVPPLRRRRLGSVGIGLLMRALASRLGMVPCMVWLPLAHPAGTRGRICRACRGHSSRPV